MFSQLRVFNASRNLLTGPIPTTWGSSGIFTLVRFFAHLSLCACSSQFVLPACAT